MRWWAFAIDAGGEETELDAESNAYIIQTHDTQVLNTNKHLL